MRWLSRTWILFLILLAVNAVSGIGYSKKEKCTKVLDVAVIGAGVSGTYMAWKIKQKYPDWNIAVYEATDRIGGRTYSVDIPGTELKAELGAMRFQSEHTRLRALLDELSLVTKDFPSVGANERFYYLRRKHLTQEDFKSGNVPYNLRQDEKFKYTYQLNNHYNRLLVDDDSSQTFRRKTKDGRLLYKLGKKNVFTEVASEEGLNFIQESSGWRDSFGANHNFAIDCDLSKRDQPDEEGQQFTVNGGFQRIADTLADKFNALCKKNEIYTGNKLVAVDSKNKNKIELRFKKTRGGGKGKTVYSTVCTKRLVLAIPKQALLELDWDELKAEPIQNMLHVVKAIPAVRVYLAYDKPWWRTIPKGAVFQKIKKEKLKKVITDLPVTQIIHYGYDIKAKKAILLCYADMEESIHDMGYLIEGTAYGGAVKTKGGYFKGTDELVNWVHIQFARVFNVPVKKIPKPEFSVGYAWQGAPYYGGWYYAAPGYKSDNVKRKLQKPVNKLEAFIVGDSYSPEYNWYIEGALRTCDEVLDKYF